MPAASSASDGSSAPEPGTRCTLCSRVIEHAYFRDPRGRFFCGLHNLVVCHYCERGFEPYASGRPVCRDCRDVAVVDAGEAQQRYDFVVDWYRSHDLAFPKGVPPLKLADSLPVGPNGLPMLGYTEKRIFQLVVQFGHVDAVVIQRGLPRFLFGTITAHELGHVYLFQHRAKLTQRMEEGICEWLGHAFALRIGTDDMKWTAQRTADNPDDIYGGGFRAFRALAGHATPKDLPKILKTIIGRSSA